MHKVAVNTQAQILVLAFTGMDARALPYSNTIGSNFTGSIFVLSAIYSSPAWIHPLLSYPVRYYRKEVMGYYVSNMIGIRTCGVFAGATDTDDMRQRIAKIVLEMREGENKPDLGDKDGDPSHCMSKELEAHKGAYVVLAGVFNYWTWKYSSEFSRRISEEFQAEVMHMCWDEERDEVQCQIWLAGKPMLEINENPIGQILRRVL